MELLRIDYDPTIRAAAIALRNLCVDPENKRAVGKTNNILLFIIVTDSLVAG